MYVGLIIYGSLETLTGGYLYDRKLVECLRARGDRVEIISLSFRNYFWSLTDNFSGTLRRRLREATFDVLIEDELNHPSLFLFNRWVRGRAPYPIVTIVHLLRASEHRSSWLNRLYRMVERRYLKGVDGAIFNSKATRTSAEVLTGSELPGIVAYPGRDNFNYEFSPEKRLIDRSAKRGPLRIIFLANVLPGKGLDTLSAALQQLPRDSWRLMVVGSITMNPGYYRRIRDRINRAGLADYVEWTGTVAHDEVPNYLAQNDVLVVPSNYEALGIAYLEAMVAGLPVIATAAGGAAEIVNHNEGGFLVRPGDVEGLAGCLKEIGRDRDRLLQMSVAAHEGIRNHPTWDESLAGIREYLEALVGRCTLAKANVAGA